MKILVTGNLRDIGIVLTDILVKQWYEVVELDTNFYEDVALYLKI